MGAVCTLASYRNRVMMWKNRPFFWGGAGGVCYSRENGIAE